MNKITFEEYKKAIKSQFEAKKIEGVYGSGDISNITPAQLRDLCLYIAQRGMSQTDEATFRFFFNINENEKFERAIENFNPGKLKSVISLLRDDKKSENRPRIELAAVIIDFNPRPFKKYCQNKGIPEITTESFLKEEYDEVGNSIEELKEDIKNEEESTGNKINKKLTVTAIVIIFLFFIGYTTRNIFFPAKQCMQWQGDHYEAIECSNNKQEIDSIDVDMMKLIKLDSSSEQVFFKNNKPVVWYSKEDGKIELFNQPGFHPESEKPLKPITNYIIERYKLKSKY